MTINNIRSIQKEIAMLINGQVLDSGDLGYKKAVTIDNGRIMHEPKLVVVPSSAEDVAGVIKYCAKKQIRLTSKSGGHSASGYSLNSEGIVLDLSALNSIELLKEDILRVGAGASWIQVYNYLRQHQSEYVAVGGGCPGVGLGGFLLGGGYSFVSRSYGLGIDNVGGIQVVSANGTIYELSENNTDKHQSNLYWALRGSGGGNFGVVTKVDLKLHKTPTPKMMMGQLTFPFYRIKEILTIYNKWVLTLPNELAVYGMLRRFPDPQQGNKPILSLRFTPVYNGNFSKGLELLKPLSDLLPKSMELYSMTIPEWENFIGNATLVSGKSGYMRSVSLAAGSLTAELAETCMKFMSRAPSDESYVVWTHCGGKIRDFGNDNSSFSNREAEFVFEVKSLWESSNLQAARPNIEWAVNFFDELETHQSVGAYINYIDPLLTDWQAKYFGYSYKKLLSIKEHWDPKNFFKFQQGIGSDFKPDREKPLDLSPLYRTF